MGKMKRFLAAVLTASLLLGTNGISYAAETAGIGSTGSTAEAAIEAVEQETEEFSDESADTSTESEAASASDAVSEEIVEEQPQEEIPDDASSEEGSEEGQIEETDDASSEEGSEEGQIEETDDGSAEENSGEGLNSLNEEESDVAATEEDSGTATTEETPAAAASEATTEEAAAAATTQTKAEEVFTDGELVYHGGSYDVTLSYDESAKIPAGAQLKVREITKGTSEYEAYLSGAQEASDKGVADARFFDITIWADGKEIQPQSAVRVNISYNNAIEVADEGEVQAMHFENGSSDPDVLDTDTNGGSEVDEIAFDAESFSVYGIVYTVDFTYEGYTFSMDGEDSILLSELAQRLNLYEKDLDKEFSVSNVSDVTFTDYDLIKIEKQADGDWLLTSLASFTSEETLTITMNDGVTFVIDVTDPPMVQHSSNLEDFMTSASINAPQKQ